MRRSRQPRQAYERRFSTKRTYKQRIHMLLRQDPSLNSLQLSRAVGCTRAHARIWRHNFFAPGFEVGEETEEQTAIL